MKKLEYILYSRIPTIIHGETDESACGGCRLRDCFLAANRYLVTREVVDKK
ncbi:MAG: hypothetical protein J7K40_09275 [candidate division Zixibacteria bacterium]|nr:hypothetical protein [candidate division Zixibacteria bacterium]